MDNALYNRIVWLYNGHVIMTHWLVRPGHLRQAFIALNRHPAQRKLICYLEANICRIWKYPVSLHVSMPFWL